MRSGRLSSSSLVFFALGSVLCVCAASAQGHADGGVKKALVSEPILDCVGLRGALESGVGQPEVLNLTGQFSCSRLEWPEAVRLERDVRVLGAQGNGVDWEDVSEAVVVGDGVLLRFEETNFLVNRLKKDSTLPFLRLEPSAMVSFAGVVIGARCCGLNQDEMCDKGSNGDKPTVKQWSSTYFKNNSTEGSIAQTTGNMCNSLITCSADSLEVLKTARDAEPQSLDANCAEDLIPELFGGHSHLARSKSAGGSNAVLWSMLVIFVVVAVSLLLGLAWARGVWRRKRRSSLSSQIIKLGPVLSCPSASSASGSVEDKLMGSTPKKVESAAEAGPQKKKPRIRTGGMDVSGIRLTIPIGKGAFGKVYKGAWGGMPVAVKILKHQPDQKTAPEKDQFEADLGFSVIHPNLVHTFGSQTRKCQDLLTTRSSRRSFASTNDDWAAGRVGTSASSDCFSDMAEVLKCQGREEYETWIVMEYCDQGSLQSTIRRGAFFDDPERTRPRMLDILLAGYDVAKGMERLHEMSIVHGDLKPQNVLLRTKKADIRGYSCKVGDFGLSRYVPDSQITTATCGAVNYMPPELLSQGVLTPAADVYSFGILMWELLVGKPLYQSKTQNDIVVLVTSGMRPQIPPNIPPPCRELLERCWQHDHQTRPSFGEVVRTLKELLADPKIEWPPVRTAPNRAQNRSSLHDFMAFSFDTNSHTPSSSLVASSAGLPPAPSTSLRTISTSPRWSEVDPLTPVQDFPPTPQDIQSGARMIPVSTWNPNEESIRVMRPDSMDVLPPMEDLLGRVHLDQKPRIPIGKKMLKP